MKQLVPLFLTKVNESIIFCVTAIPFSEPQVGKDFKWVSVLIVVAFIFFLSAIIFPPILSATLGVVSLVGALIMSLKIVFDKENKNKRDKGCAGLLAVLIALFLWIIYALSKHYSM